MSEETSIMLLFHIIIRVQLTPYLYPVGIRGLFPNSAEYIITDSKAELGIRIIRSLSYRFRQKT